MKTLRNWMAESTEILGNATGEDQDLNLEEARGKQPSPKFGEPIPHGKKLAGHYLMGPGGQSAGWFGAHETDKAVKYVKNSNTRYTLQPSYTDIKEQDESLEEGSGGHDVELKPHSNGTHYIVHKISEKSGIEPDQLKVGEKISDTHVDDLHDMGYRVKIHKK